MMNILTIVIHYGPTLLYREFSGKPLDSPSLQIKNLKDREAR
jgi:hypothetical protein